MLFGAIAAIAHGAVFPLLWLFLGNFVDVFIAQTVTTTLFSRLNLTADATCSTPIDVVNNVTVTVGDLIQQNATMCISGDAFINEVNNITYAFIGIGLAALIVAYVQIAFIQTAAERQVYKIRLRYYRAVLRQDIAWFDVNPTGEVSTRLSE